MIDNIKPGNSLPVIEKDIDQDRIMRWAELSGDFNKLHVDPEFASKTQFKGSIAHGPMSLAFLNELLMHCFGEHWAVGGKLLNVRFVAPVRPGERIRVTGEVKKFTQEQGVSVVECDVYVEKAGAEKAVIGNSVVRIPTEAG